MRGGRFRDFLGDALVPAGAVAVALPRDRFAARVLLRFTGTSSLVGTGSVAGTGDGFAIPPRNFFLFTLFSSVSPTLLFFDDGLFDLSNEFVHLKASDIFRGCVTAR